jgi:acetyl esterase/lipase
MRKGEQVRRSFVATLGCLMMGIALASPAVGQQSGIQVRKDITYVLRPGRSLTLDAYLPAGPGLHPGVLVIPGGRWMFIDKTRNDWLPRQLAAQGIASFSIEYRPSTEAPFPAALEDAQAAVRFVRAHAARFHVDPERLGAYGGSSGGHLAALLATWGEGATDVGSRVQVAISLSGPMDLAPLLHDPDHFVVDAVETFLGCSSGPACIETARRASPVSHIDPTDGAIYLANGLDEIIPASQARGMAAALARSGVPHELFLMSEGHHGLSSAHSYKGFDPAFAFLTRWIDADAVAAGGPEPSPSPEKAGASDPVVGGQVSPGNKPEVPSTTRSNATRDWLPVIAVTAFVIALIALLLTVVLLRQARKSPRRDSDREPGDPHDDDPDRLVSSRADNVQ